MKKDIYVPIFGIPIAALIAGELMIFYGDVFYGLGIHMVNLLAITLIIIFMSSLDIKMKNILRYIILIILSRMIILSMPLSVAVALQYLLICGIIAIPIYYIIKDKLILYKESRIESMRFYVPLVVTTMIGLIMVISQYGIFSPITLEGTYISGKFTTIYLIISIIITLLLSYTKYWNKYTSDTLDMSSNSLLSIFVIIAVYKMISVL